jgi:hypothetical protein
VLLTRLVARNSVILFSLLLFCSKGRHFCPESKEEVLHENSDMILKGTMKAGSARAHRGGRTDSMRKDKLQKYDQKVKNKKAARYLAGALRGSQWLL